MIRLAGLGKSGERSRYPPPLAPSSSSSTLSPLAPPFTVDRSLPALTNPNSLPPPPPTGAMSPYFVPTGDSVWSSSSSAASRLTNLNSGFGAVEATPYYPYYAPVRDSVDGTLEKMSDYKGYVGGWSGTFDLEEGRPARGSVVNSSWMDSLTSCQMSLALKKRGTVESFGTYEDSFGSWHGAHNESSSTLGHVGSECSDWLDDSHREIYVEKSRVPTDGSCAVDTSVWPTEGSSYFYSPETTSVVKECDTFTPSSYDRYISQLICPRDPIVHYSALTSSSRQGYASSNERNESLLSCSVLKHGNSVIKHVNLHKKNDDYADYVMGMQNEASIYESAEGKEAHEKMGISDVAMQRNSGTPCSCLLVKGLSSGNSAALGQSIDCLQDVKFGFKVANLSCCNSSNSERGTFIPDDSMQASPEVPDHLNIAVDSPCWKGASVSRRYPFSSDEILQPLVLSVTSGSDDLVQGQRSLKIRSDIEKDDTFVCDENGKDIPSEIPKDLSPVTDFSGSDLKRRDCAERGSNPAKVENAKETEQHDIRGEHISLLIEQISIPHDIDGHGQSSKAENIICEAGSITGETVPAVQNSDFDTNHVSTSLNYSSSNTNASNVEMNLSSLNAIFPSELKKPVSSDAPSKCLSQGQDVRVLVKAMLSLSEVLLCHYCNDDEALEECDLKPVQQIIDNLQAVILRNKKGIIGSCSRVPRVVEETRPDVKESNANMSSNKLLNDANGNKNVMSSGLNNDKHDNIVKSFNTNFEESDGMAQDFAKVLKIGFIEQEEDPKILLYKNLWVQTEATLCSLKHDVALMKLEMGSFKHHFKAKSQVSSDGLAEPMHVMGTLGKSSLYITDERDSHRCKDHEGLNCGTCISVENPSRSNTQVEKNHKQSIILKEDEIDASVFARFRILKGRDEVVLSGTDEPQELNAVKSYVDREKIRELKELSPNLTDVNTIEKGVLQSHNMSNFTVVSPKKNMAGEKHPGLDHRMGSGLFLNNTEPAGVQESLLSASDGSVIQSYNPKSHGKWLFLSGSDSPSSEWEHVLKDEFIW